MSANLKIIEDKGNTSEFGRFILEPLERGYGRMVGNSLRRVLLSSMPGTCVSSVRIDGVLHEFSATSGVVEDVTEIIMNLKRLVLRSTSESPVKISIVATGPRQVTAADIQPHQSVKVIQPNTYICEITNPSITMNMEMTVERGLGFFQAQTSDKAGDLHTIYMDKNFSPVRRVTFNVEEVKAGGVHDRLIIDVHTNGGILPAEAMRLASEIIQQHFEILTNFAVETKLPDEQFKSVRDDKKSEQRAHDISIKELEFSVRSRNCLEQENIKTLGELASKRASELLAIKNFGKKSLNEIREKLAQYGLALKDEEVYKPS